MITLNTKQLNQLVFDIKIYTAYIIRKYIGTTTTTVTIIIAAEKEEHADLKLKQPVKGPAIKMFVDRLMGDVAVAADKLETDLDDFSFEKNLHGVESSKLEIESVIRVGGAGGAEGEKFVSILLYAKLCCPYNLSLASF